ncbi:hypothetical protein ABH940_005386 [Streptacidiphilus sp. BW17]|uniref:hypothetical protein n=1 Tax=Streptacidiphilus sp. BW17 TaxID=3156274 RepID=UPI0035126F32
MALTFIGIDPDTKGTGSPTVWIDPDTNDIVIQGWKASEELRRQVVQTPAPNHEPGIPEGEDVIIIPARLAPALRKACDDVERVPVA